MTKRKPLKKPFTPQATIRIIDEVLIIGDSVFASIQSQPIPTALTGLEKFREENPVAFCQNCFNRMNGKSERLFCCYKCERRFVERNGGNCLCGRLKNKLGTRCEVCAVKS